MSGYRIVQIMPAPEGLFAITYDDSGNQKEVPLLCLGLADCGVIKFFYLEDGRACETKEVIDRRGKWESVYKERGLKSLLGGSE